MSEERMSAIVESYARVADEHQRQARIEREKREQAQAQAAQTKAAWDDLKKAVLHEVQSLNAQLQAAGFKLQCCAASPNVAGTLERYVVSFEENHQLPRMTAELDFTAIKDGRVSIKRGWQSPGAANIVDDMGAFDASRLNSVLLEFLEDCVPQ